MIKNKIIYQLAFGDILKNKYVLVIVLLVLMLFSILMLNMPVKKNNTYNSSINWSYDKNEYPLEEYRIDELPVSHKSSYEIRQFFEDSDVNHDGVLIDQELNTFDYKIKHSQYGYNGPYGYN